MVLTGADPGIEWRSIGLDWKELYEAPAPARSPATVDADIGNGVLGHGLLDWAIPPSLVPSESMKNGTRANSSLPAFPPSPAALSPAAFGLTAPGGLPRQLTETPPRPSAALSADVSDALSNNYTTPESATLAKSQTTPPPMPPAQPRRTSLRAAICAGSADRVKAAIQQDPDASWSPFIEQGAAEPPLCCAARLQRGEDVLSLLLQSGAKVNAQDHRGQSALLVLAEAAAAAPEDSAPSWDMGSLGSLPWDAFVGGGTPAPLQVGGLQQRREPQRRRLRLASLLLAAGADPELADDRGRRPEDVAAEASVDNFAALCRYHGGVQAFAALRRALSQSGPSRNSGECSGLRRLHASSVFAICEMLVPGDVLVRANALLGCDEW